MSIDMNTLISQMIMFFVILGCGFVGAKLGLLKAEVIHGLSSLLMGVICPLMLIAVFPSAVQEENAWDIAKSVIPIFLTRISFITFHARSKVILNLALVPLNTKESVISRSLASEREDREFLKDSYLFVNFSSILFYVLQ